MGMSLRTAARQEATGASECVRVVRARAGGDHRAALCMRVKVATGGGRGATMDLRAKCHISKGVYIGKFV